MTIHATSTVRCARSARPLGIAAAIALALGAALAAQEPAQQPPPAALRLAARVLDENGAPLAGAALAVGTLDELATAAVLEHPQQRSGDDGRIALAIPAAREGAGPGVGDLRLAMLVAEGRLCAVVPLQGPPRTIDLGDVVLPPAVPLRGVVRRQDGTPLAGARVRADDALQAFVTAPWAGPNSLQFAATARTDANGRFELPVPPDTGARLAIDAAGHCDAELPFVRAGDPVVVALQPSGFVAGVVRGADGAPSAATVWVVYEVENISSRPFPTADGTFRIGIAHPHRFRLHAQLDGEQQELVSSDVLAGPQEGVVLAAADGGPADGAQQPANDATGREREEPAGAPATPRLVVRTVDDVTGKAVEAVTAAVFWLPQDVEWDETTLAGMLRHAGVTSRQPGEIRLPGPGEEDPTTGILRVEAKGYAPLTLRGVEWSDDEPPELEARLVPEAVLRGVVVDAITGEPVAGAAVTVAGAAADVPAWRAWQQWQGGDTETPASDAAGRFRIAQLAAGSWRVSARLGTGPASPAVAVELAAGQESAELRLVLPRGATLSGTLRGGPLPPGAALRLRPHQVPPQWLAASSFPFAGDPVPPVPVDAAGAFAVRGLDRGDYELELRLPHRHGRGGELLVPLEPLRVRRKDLRRDVDLADAQPGIIRGTVACTGAAVETTRLVVLVHRVDEPQPFGFDGFASFDGGGMATLAEPVAADGTFALAAAPGSYVVRLADLATRVELTRVADVQIDEGQVATIALAAELVRTTVELVPAEAGQPIVASRLDVFVPRDGETYQPSPWSFAAAGVSLADGRTRVELLLPARPVQLVVLSNAGALLDGEFQGEPTTLATHDLTPQAGSGGPVRIEVPAPPQ